MTDDGEYELEDALADGGEQPRCPRCGVLMRTATAGFVCPEDGHLEEFPDGIVWPGAGNGIASVHGG